MKFPKNFFYNVWNLYGKLKIQNVLNYVQLFQQAIGSASCLLQWISSFPQLWVLWLECQEFWRIPLTYIYSDDALISYPLMWVMASEEENSETLCFELCPEIAWQKKTSTVSLLSSYIVTAIIYTPFSYKLRTRINKLRIQNYNQNTFLDVIPLNCASCYGDF